MDADPERRHLRTSAGKGPLQGDRSAGHTVPCKGCSVERTGHRRRRGCEGRKLCNGRSVPVPRGWEAENAVVELRGRRLCDRNCGKPDREAHRTVDTAKSARV